MVRKANKKTGGKFQVRRSSQKLYGLQKRSGYSIGLSRKKALQRINDHGRVAGKYRFEGKDGMYSSRSLALNSFGGAKPHY